MYFFVFLGVDYRLVIVCSTGEQEKTHIISRLSSYERKMAPLPSDQEIADYLGHHYTSSFRKISISSQPSSSDRYVKPTMGSCIRIVLYNG